MSEEPILLKECLLCFDDNPTILFPVLKQTLVKEVPFDGPSIKLGYTKNEYICMNCLIFESNKKRKIKRGSKKHNQPQLGEEYD